ncbi:MAG: IS1595 family transposase [Nitrospirae bacterium]|nr:IS1595 family transposase [Nitrospirota bacterium]
MEKPYEDINLIEFQSKYKTEEDCEKRLFELRWPNGYECPRCGNKEYIYLPKRKLYECKNKDCYYQASVTAGTVMHRTRTPLLKWFWAIYLLVTDKRGLSALALSKKLAISTWVAWTMMHKIRKGMSDRDTDYKLAGIIEMDDSYFGGTREDDKRGRGTGKTAVLIEVATNDDAMNYAKMTVIDAVRGENILNTINGNVQPKQVFKTDGFSAYNIINTTDHQHQKKVVKGKKAHTVLKWVHILASNAKSFLDGTYHVTGKKHLQRYLDEFCYRLNRRKWEGQLFDRLVTACACSPGVTWAELTS